MNTTERKKKEAERNRKARLQESDEQKRIRLQANADSTREYRAALTPEQRKAEVARKSAYRERRTEDQIISGRLSDSARKAASREQASKEERNSRRYLIQLEKLQVGNKHLKKRGIQDV